MFHKLPVTFFSLAYRQAKQLYLTAFPPEERLPLWALVVNAVRSGVDFVAYYDEEEFVGFSYTISDDLQQFVLFLSVNEAVQSRRYGTKILHELIQSVPDKPTILTIEPVEAGAANMDQRRKRLVFYERNGFRQTETFYYENTERYQVLTTQQPFDALAFRKLVKKASLGLVKVDVR